MYKQMISLFLCLVLIISVLPVQSAATQPDTENLVHSAETVPELEGSLAEDTAPSEKEPVPEETEQESMESGENLLPSDPSESVEPESTEPESTEPESKEPAPADPESTDPDSTDPDPADPEPTEPQITDLVRLEASDLNSEELLLGYLSPMHTGGEASTFGFLAGQRLSPANKYVYGIVKERVIQIARGEENNTRIEINFKGLDFATSDVNIELVQDALLCDLPFDMYWYRGCLYGSSSTVFLIVLEPNNFYKLESGFDPSFAPYIDQQKTKKAAASAENIYSIVSRYEFQDDYDKLAAYADEICAMVEYDYDAANNNTFADDCNPWALISVFDSDPATNVVCEGYAEAFQFLCEESVFTGNISCYGVTGSNHKWNIVQIEGISYLMDVTHCDRGNYAYRGPKFLGGGEGSVLGGYSIGGFHYAYYDKTLAVYGSGEDSILNLSATPYPRPVKYLVVYDANGGRGAPNSQNKNPGIDLPLRGGIPTREGYRFLGWATSPWAANALYQPGDAYNQDEDIFLYAVWEPLTSGTCGEDLSWSFDESTGVLAISGTGPMPDYTSLHPAPWYPLRDSIEEVTLGSDVSSLGDYAFADCLGLKSLTVPGNIRTLGKGVFLNCTDFKTITFLGAVPEFHEDTFATVSVSLFYPALEDSWSDDLLQRPDGIENWTGIAPVQNRVALPAADLSGFTSVWIDGQQYALTTQAGSSYVDLPDGDATSMIAYTYNGEQDVQEQYPIGMKVWTLENKNGIYTATYAPELDDILQYAGMSIRITGKKGIRMLTALESTKKDNLEKGLLAGFTLQEYGTLVAWDAQLDEDTPLVLGQSYSKSNHAFLRDEADFILEEKNGKIFYTNVLVGFNDAQCARTLAIRPYMILEDAQGREVTLYGGIVHRSIGYIAYQNRGSFPAGTESYEYVWSIIHNVYGDRYDLEYMPT